MGSSVSLLLVLSHRLILMPARREILRVRLGDQLADDLGGRAVEGPCQCGSRVRSSTIQAQHKALLIMARVMRSTGSLSRTPAGWKVPRHDEAQGLAPPDSRTDYRIACGRPPMLHQCRLHKHVDEVHSGWQGGP
ncbi:MAG: hypothetical protein M3361_06455 [Candidatus Tectomicrobia bacterium]|nr:hypothetical protein [Candidatus Tectomicrobia bacterium]